MAAPARWRTTFWSVCNLDIALTVFWGVVVLLVLVVVHEAGHFIAARAFHVRVTEFMIGLPGPNIGFKWHGTKFGVTAVPLGGYNRITGLEAGPEDPNLGRVLAYVYRQGAADEEHVALGCGLSADEAADALAILDEWGSVNAPGRDNKTDKYAAPETGEFALGQPREVPDEKALLDSERAQTYRGLKMWQRLVVLFAGPLMNVALAVVLLLVLFCGIGVSVASPTISGVTEDGPAAAAGLQAGDTIVELDGTRVEEWADLTEALSGLSAGREVSLSYERDGREHRTSVTLGDAGQGKAQLGVLAGVAQKQMAPGEALKSSWDYLVLTVGSYASLFNPATAGETLSQSSSVVGIAAVTKQAAETSVVSLLYIVAVISMSLGIVNLVPLPPLDGGKIVVELVQKVIRREIPARVISTITTVVIVLLLVLFVVLVRQDVLRFFMGG